MGEARFSIDLHGPRLRNGNLARSAIDGVDY